MGPEGEGTVEIRQARADDIGRLVELLAYGALGGGPAPDVPDLGPYAAALAEIEATDGNELLVAEVDGTVVGVCQLIVFRHFQSSGGRCAEIESMHVHPDWRSHGVGGELVEAAVARASAAGCYRVQLTSNKAREEAHRFYRRHGFVASHEGFKRLP
jgi:GNAT superfamily N-acetyltransferase